MAIQRSKTSRRLIALVEGLFLLHGLLMSAAHAVSTPPPVATSPLLISDAGESQLAGSRGTDLYLDLSLNGMLRGLVPFGLRDGELWASAAVLRQLGFVLPAGNFDQVRVASLPGVQVQFDAGRQSVAITAPLALLKLPTTVIGETPATAQAVSTSPGILLNYDLYGTQGSGNTSSLNAFTEIRAFNGSGVLSNTTLMQSSRSESAGVQGHTARLDTTWSRSFQDELLTLRVGDTLTAALPWSRATRIGGIQLSRNFALQPYKTTAPLPAFIGSATLPSEVELYVNGMRQYRGQVPAGPFQLNTLPNINSTGQAQVVLTDALGRATTLNFSLYDTHQLLAKGLSDWSVDLGAVRQNYGLSSFDYGRDPVASGTWRYGVSDSFTLETHGEATRGLAAAGAGGAWQLGGLGLLSGAVAQSSHGAGNGTQFNLGYSWQNQHLNFGLDSTRTRGDYRDVASLYGSATPTGTGRTLVGYSTENLGSFGATYLYLRYAGQDATRFASAYWFKSLGRSASFNVSLNQNLAKPSERNLFVGVSWALDGGTSISTGLQRDNTRTSYTADAQNSAPSEGGFGWRAGTRVAEGQNGGQAELNYLGRYGRVATGVSIFGDSRYAYVNASGGLVFMGGQPFASRRIDSAFAVVSTDGVAGVPVMLENRKIGLTDSKGMLLVVPLNAYQNNQLAIDPMQLPASLRLTSTKMMATPSDRAGTLVRFGITPIRAASILLVDAANQPMPVGSLVRVNGQGGEPALVGFDGVVYLDTLDTHNVLNVVTPDGACRVSFDYLKDGEGIPEIGPLRCVKDTSQ
ncbi:fimbria/pilus outer membrane usher protein [Polaromonas sp.]|uniref:fimbria/pilus outer membrane usher protein n=1 Tax=Polaromonas sp. TaxID=1869339 RepID=UPI0018511A20|nr:fimbria/pilus outer membrane usher protein [Polaromonas sp.]NML86812.1 fimbrial biogenesis outer membrane usher protein [Polaromonas sp.]